MTLKYCPDLGSFGTMVSRNWEVLVQREERVGKQYSGVSRDLGSFGTDLDCVEFYYFDQVSD